MNKINDGQLDEAQRQIAALQRTVDTLCEVCVRRLELLKRVMYCRMGVDSQGREDVRLTPAILSEIEREISLRNQRAA